MRLLTALTGGVLELLTELVMRVHGQPDGMLQLIHRYLIYQPLIAPADLSYTNDITPTFQWTQVTSKTKGTPVTYCLQVATDTLFGPTSLVIDTCGLTNNSYTVTDSSLLDTLTYYWHVEAVDDAGNNSGYQADPFMFTIDTIPPDVPVLISPTDFTYTNNNIQTFVWGQVTLKKSSSPAAPVTYCLQVATDASFDPASMVIDTRDLTDTTFTVSNSLPDADYYWRVEALDKAGNSSGYQDPPSIFTIDTHAPMFSGTTMWTDTSFGGPYSVTSIVTDALSGIDSVFLYYRFNVGIWESTPMVSADSLYEAQIPGTDIVAKIDYYLRAIDLATNEATDPFGAPDSFYSFMRLGIAEQASVSIPTVFALSQNRPNPFSRTTIVSYQIPVSADGRQPSAVSLRIYALTGKLVRILVSESQEPGYYKVRWDGRDD